MACQECHLLGAQKTLRRGILHMFWEMVKGGKPSSVRDVGFKWIDLVGVVLLPLVLAFVIVHAGLRAVGKR